MTENLIIRHNFFSFCPFRRSLHLPRRHTHNMSLSFIQTARIVNSAPTYMHWTRRNSIRLLQCALHHVSILHICIYGDAFLNSTAVQIWINIISGTLRARRDAVVGDWIDRINLCMITMQHTSKARRLLCILFVDKVFGDSSGFSTFSRVSRAWKYKLSRGVDDWQCSIYSVKWNGWDSTARRRSAQIKLYCWDILKVKVICI